MMLKRFGILLYLLIGLLAACSLPSTTTDLKPTLVSSQVTAVSTPTPAATQPPTATVPPQPDATATARIPTFSQLNFQTSNGSGSVFPSGTEEVFAVWQYHNMTAEDFVQRVWRYNGEPWLEREELWDFDTYSATGTVNNISVYNFEGGGLAPGHYELTLYINGQPQAHAAFEIEGTAVVTLSAEAQSFIAQVLNGSTLVLQNGRNESTEIAQMNHIVELVWFVGDNNGLYLLWVDQDSSQQISGATLGIKHALWLVDITTMAQVQLGSYEDDFHSVSVANDGLHIAAISGTNYGDACFVDRNFYILELNDAHELLAVNGRSAFEGAPVSEDLFIYPVDNGRWLDGTTFEIGFDITCVNKEEVPELAGVYQLDVEGLTAVRSESLPPK